VCEGVDWIGGSGLGPVVGSCEHGTDSSGCIKGKKFIDQISNFELLKKDFTP
jgi:hypothetical protein